MRKTRLWAMAMLAGLILAFSWACSSAAEAPRIDNETVKGWLGNPQVVILDVRSASDWQDSKNKIKGAVRQDPQKVQAWAASLRKDKKIVLYCA